jgi:hypothetical protein
MFSCNPNIVRNKAFPFSRFLFRFIVFFLRLLAFTAGFLLPEKVPFQRYTCRWKYLKMSALPAITLPRLVRTELPPRSAASEALLELVIHTMVERFRRNAFDLYSESVNFDYRFRYQLQCKKIDMVFLNQYTPMESRR